jgi:hypothetical protein
LPPPGRARDRSAYATSKKLAKTFEQAVGSEDNALVAGAIVLFATQVILRSSQDVLEARAYLEGMRGAIDKLVNNAFRRKIPGRR